MSKAWRVLFVAVVCALGSQAGAQNILNIDEIVKDLKVGDFKGKAFTRKIKVAVIDNGFYGFEKELGKSLPQDTKYHAGAASDADKIDNRGLHGLFMAQMTHQLLVKSGAKTDVELHLFYAFGYTKFADAVKTVTDEKFDIVLYSQVWEYGGNGDGRGFINTLVNEATSKGVIWINASGNFGMLTRLNAVDGKMDGTDEWVQFKDPMTFKVACSTKKGELCGIRLVLSWNDFKDDADTGTDKDLDLFLLDSKKKVMLSSERHQKLVKDLTDPLASMFPRELIETKLAPGTYSLKVKVKSKNFSASQDQLRITLSGEGVTLSNPSIGETLLPPADNSSVIVVGASDDLNSNRSDKNGKPDLWLKSLIRMKDGSAPFSTSIAAAMAAGVSTLHLGTGTSPDRLALLEKLKPISRTDGVVKLKPKTKEPAVADKKKDTKTVEVKTAPTEQQPVATEPKPEEQKTQETKPVESKTTETKTKSTEDTDEKPVRRTSRPSYTNNNARLPHSYPAIERLMRSGAGVTYVRGRMAIAVKRGQVDLSNMDDDQVPVISPEGIRFYGPEDLVGGLPDGYYQIVIVNK